MKKYFTFTISFFLLFNGILYGQSNFTLKSQDDTVCVDEIFSPINKSTSTSDYLWHFNSANMANSNMPPTGTNLGKSGFPGLPTFISLAQDSGIYYTFTTNLDKRNITRNRYGYSLTNTPISDNIPISSLPVPTEGIQVVKEGNNWYALIIGGKEYSSRLVCLYFGNSLKNTPIVIFNENFKSNNYPMDLTLLKVDGHWHGFTVNTGDSSITRFDFSKLSIRPNSTELTFGGKLKLPWSLSHPINSNGNWYMFVTCNSSNTLKRIEFGNSLTNDDPQVKEINSTYFNQPMAIRIVRDCEKTFGIVADRQNKAGSWGSLIQLNFIKGIENEPTFIPLVNIGSLRDPLGMTEIIRSGNDIFTFITNQKDTSVTRVQYSPGVTPPVSTNMNPSSSYPDSGNYNINLTAWQDSLFKSCNCHNIQVLDKPGVTLGNDTTICPYDRLLIGIEDTFATYLWSNGSTEKTTYTDSMGIYWLETTNTNGCKGRDSITISPFPDNLFLGNDTVLYLGQSLELIAGYTYSSYKWNTGDTTSTIEVRRPGIYGVFVKETVPGSAPDTRYCLFSDTIKVDVDANLPNFVTPNNDSYNDTWPKPQSLFINYPDAKIYIYDRFGKNIVNLDERKPEWDGTYNNKVVTPDTYWYVIDLRDGSTPMRGSITVVLK